MTINTNIFYDCCITPSRHWNHPERIANIPTGTACWIHVDSSWIRRYVEEQISTNFYVISSYFFDVILVVEKSTSFPSTFIDVISLVEKSTLFPRTFFDVISMVKNSTLFLVSCKLMKTFEKVFAVFVNLNSWLSQDCSL